MKLYNFINYLWFCCRDFNESLSTIIHEAGCNSTIKLSSAGLVYCHFGHEIIKQLAPVDTSDDIIKVIFKSVYYKLIQEIDAIDNGIPMFDQEPLLVQNIKKKKKHFYICSFNLVLL